MKLSTFKKTWFVAALALATALAGCELIVDFDRSKIPVADTDSGVIPTPTDGSIPETGATDGGSDAATDAPSTTDGGSDAAANDAGSDAPSSD